MAYVRPLDSPVEWHTVAEAARVSGLSVDMVNYLSRHELVTASGTKTPKRGRQRRYLFTDLILLRAVAQMLERGISVLRLKKCLSSVRQRGVSLDELLCRRYLVTDGYNVFFQDAGGIEALESGQLAFAFVLELSAIRASIVANLGDEQRIARA